MSPITKPQIIIINTLLAQIGKARNEPLDKGEKAALILQASGGRTDSTTLLYFKEASRLIMELRERIAPSDAAARMRRHIIAMAHEMRWELKGGQADMERIDRWCERYGLFKKKLNAHTSPELQQLVSQFKNVYYSYLKSIKTSMK